MRLIILHDINNPSREVPLDPTDYSNAAPMNTGAAVRLKSSDVPILVHESPEEVRAIIEGER